MNTDQNDINQPTLDERKKELEVQLLEEQLAERRKPFAGLRQLTWPNLTAIGALLAGLLLAYANGLFDARQQYLAARTERLRTEELALQKRNAELVATGSRLENDIARLSNKLEGVTTKLTGIEKENAALLAIAIWDGEGFYTAVDIDVEADSVQVGIHRRESHGDEISTPELAKNLSYMLDIPRLTELEISGFDLAKHSVMDDISKLKQLRELRLSACTLTDDLQQLPLQLRILQLSQCGLSDARLETLPHFPDLEVLRVLFDEGIRRPHTVARFQRLRDLSLMGTSLTDDGLQLLAPLCKSLRDFSLDGTGVTDRCLEDLNQFRLLHSLSLRGTTLTREGCSRLSIPSLGNVNVNVGVRPDEEVIAAMSEKMPNLNIREVNWNLQLGDVIPAWAIRTDSPIKFVPGEKITVTGQIFFPK